MTRLFVVNGQKIIQEKSGDEWIDRKVCKAGRIAPGVYDLSKSCMAEQANSSYLGVVLFINESKIYQQDGPYIIKHDKDIFVDKVNEGALLKITYDEHGNMFSDRIRVRS